MKSLVLLFAIFSSTFFSPLSFINTLPLAPGISLTALDATYIQQFNTLAVSGTASNLPNGWSFTESGTKSDANYTADDGTSGTGDTYSYGALNNQDRALGTLQSSSLSPIIGASFTNDTGKVITRLEISYTGEQWRLGTTGRADRLDFQYSTTSSTLTSGNWIDVDALDFSSPMTTGTEGELDGNAAGNRRLVSATITGLEIPSGTTFFIRWIDFNASGRDDGLAVDDFSLRPIGGIVTPPQLIAIHDIQGAGSASPLVNTTVTSSGIVTALKSNGFFMQTPFAAYDKDPNTSEGIFVFTGATPPSWVTPGNEVRVTGNILEYRPASDAASPPLTELQATSPVVLISSGNQLPTAIVLTSAATAPNGSLEQLEKYEGMLVQATSLTVVAPTGGFFEQGGEANAISTSDGVFYAVITGIARPFREPGTETETWPAGIPRFDGNPERLRVDSNDLTGAVSLDLTSGVVLTNVIGILSYASRAYTILPLPGNQTQAAVAGNISAVPVPPVTAQEFTVASFNLERFFDTNDDAGKNDVVLTSEAFNRRLQKASLAIRNILQLPDIIGVEEMENLATLQQLAAKINSDAVAGGQTDPNYVAYLEEGNDIGGIDVGFLVKSTRVTVGRVTQQGKDATFVNPANGQRETLNDRPPLILQAKVNSPAGVAFPITVIVNHLRSLLSIEDPASGDRVRQKRRAQAEYLANLIQARQAADPDERIISIGDYNAFQFSDGLVDTIGTIKGTPAAANQVVLASSDLVNPDLTDLIELVPVAQRYSYVFGGNAQAIDHELVNAPLMNYFSRVAFARNNADFPDVYRNDAKRPERISDHDAAVAYFNFASRADGKGRTTDRRDVPSRNKKPE